MVQFVIVTQKTSDRIFFTKKLDFEGILGEFWDSSKKCFDLTKILLKG